MRKPNVFRHNGYRSRRFTVRDFDITILLPLYTKQGPYIMRI